MYPKIFLFFLTTNVLSGCFSDSDKEEDEENEDDERREGSQVGDCIDGEDNDEDGDIDCDDSGCENTPACDDSVIDDTPEDEDFFTASGLPDLREDMVPDDCDFGGSNSPAATSYYLGTYIREQGSWIGKERWYLLPNAAWIEVEDEITEEGCFVTWDMTAEETSCSSCSLALSVDGNINHSETNCPEGLWSGYEEWSIIYHINITGEDTEFLFESGNLMGEGYASPTAMSFLSPAECKYF